MDRPAFDRPQLPDVMLPAELKLSGGNLLAAARAGLREERLSGYGRGRL